MIQSEGAVAMCRRTAASRHRRRPPTSPVLLYIPPYYSTTAILSFAYLRVIKQTNGGRPISNSFRPSATMLLPSCAFSCVSREGWGEASFYLRVSASIPHWQRIRNTECGQSSSLSSFFLYLRRAVPSSSPRLASKPL